ncbi:hypothetical protein B0F90DRAFT_1816018 [Multifurca ochricompacta]|uniref:DUF6534 domain-containing protein n=1 Tax=Multifurca ochricompacta TaxID=376703 RepID=A0AAD4M738_9AGAM|nr:hypothetical protein B0F90DRAFT_1816018 [Multifurca ochricompacta]
MLPSLQNTVGALLAGAMFSAAFSGVLSVQIFLYHRRYPKDHKLYKVMVAWFWLAIPLLIMTDFSNETSLIRACRVIDTVQTTCIAVSMWNYLIRHFGDPEVVVHIYSSVSIATLCTALTAACVNILQGVRIYELNHHTFETLVPHIILSLTRFGLSITTITKLLITGSLVTFGEHYKPLLHTNFLLAAIADTYIASVLCYFLKDSRRDAPMGTKRMLDTLVIVTVNNGALTSCDDFCMTLFTILIEFVVSIVSIATVITWLTMQTNTIFLAIHLTTGKFYSNSQMAT